MDYVVSQGLLSGSSRSHFSPEQPLNRAMLAQVLFQLAGQPDGGLTHFTDVPDTAWCYSAVSWAVSPGHYERGVDGETFAPERPPTRQELALTLFRYAKEAGLDTKSAPELTPLRRRPGGRLGPGGRGVGSGPGPAGRPQRRRRPDPRPAGHCHPGGILRRAQRLCVRPSCPGSDRPCSSPRFRPRDIFLPPSPFGVKVWNICPNYSYPQGYRGSCAPPLRRGPEKGDAHDPRPVFPRRREHAAREAERQELLASLASTRTLIQQAYGGFNTVSDSDLIESYVFEIKALQSRYDYLLRRVKELECARDRGLPPPWLALGLLLLAGLALLRRPLGQLLRLAVRSSVGLAVLALFSQVKSPHRRQSGSPTRSTPWCLGSWGPWLRPSADAPVGPALVLCFFSASMLQWPSAGVLTPVKERERRRGRSL